MKYANIVAEEKRVRQLILENNTNCCIMNVPAKINYLWRGHG
jgi:hypothetical protein